jgi:peptidoglycan glycosyltransferase
VDRQIRRVGIGFVLLFALLFGQLTYVQVVEADRIANDPANAARQIIAEYKVERGLILTEEGVVLAKSVEGASTFRFDRAYPFGDLYGHITGYYSRIFGRSGLEEAMNDELAGDAPELAIQNLSEMILGRPREGASIVVTIDHDLQMAASEALGDLPGGVAAIDPNTGDILALVSNPSFDPSQVSTGTERSIRRAWDRLTNTVERPLISRATAELFAPGSSFKIVTASAALENGFGINSSWPNPHRLELEQTTNQLRNFADVHCNNGSATISLLEGFVESCNVTFGEVALKVGEREMAEQARAFGFCPTFPPTRTDCLEETIPFVLPFETGRFPDPVYFADQQPLLAFSGVGLDNDLTNPLMQALVAGAVANQGTMMQPRLVTTVLDPQGRPVREYDVEQFGQPITDETALALTDMMRQVVSRGTAFSAFADSPIRDCVAGKTGTATGGEGEAPHAWFTAFAPAGRGPTIAVAVIVENGGGDREATGGAVAAPVARAVLEAYLGGC